MSLAPIGAIVVLGIPAAIVAVIPRRRLPAAMTAWFVSPAIIFLGFDLVGNIIGTAQSYPGDFSGALLLVGSLFLIPWIIICLLGFGIGFAIRRRVKTQPRSEVVGPAPEPLTIASPIRIQRPVQPIMEGVTPDGALRYEHQQGEFINGRYDSVSLCAVLTDIATGHVLVDCAGWASSEITAQTDGSLFLHLQQNQFELLFRIDGRAGIFRDLGAGGSDEPLANLADAVKKAWLATAPHVTPPQYRRISPDGTIRVDLAWQEWSNSRWANAPRVTDMGSGRILLDLWGTNWDATVYFEEVGRVRLACLRCHVGGGLSVVIDAARGCYQIALHAGSGGMLPEQAIDDIAKAMEKASLSGGMRSAFPASPHPLAAWRAALLILVGALILLAGTSYLSIRLGH